MIDVNVRTFILFAILLNFVLLIFVAFLLLSSPTDQAEIKKVNNYHQSDLYKMRKFSVCKELSVLSVFIV